MVKVDPSGNVAITDDASVVPVISGALAVAIPLRVTAPAFGQILLAGEGLGLGLL
jgi:hypothetical protein